MSPSPPPTREVYRPSDAARRRRSAKARIRVLAFAGAVALLGAFGLWQSRRAPPAVPELDLEIRPRALQQLAAARALALERGILFASERDYVPATLRVGGRDGRAYRVAVRLKGDQPDHFEGQRQSMRVKVKRGERIFGLRRFSLQVPHTRGDQNEALFFDFLRSQGILAPRYFFVRLRVNGDAPTPMAVEEHVSVELLEAQQRRESVVLKYDEEDLWRSWLAIDHWTADFNNWRNSPIRAFQPAEIDASPRLTADLEVAAGLLRAAMDDRLRPAQVFDAPLWGRLLASCELFSAHHMVYWNNLRFYYNPITARLEPLAFDANVLPGRDPVERFQCQGRRLAFADALLDDPAIRREFLRSLRELAGRVRGEPFRRWLAARDAAYRDALAGADPPARPFDLDALARRAARLSTVTAERYADFVLPRARGRSRHPPDAEYPRVVHAQLLRGEGGSRLELANAISRRVVVRELRFAQPELEARTPLAALLPRRLPLELEASRWPRPPARAALELRAPLAADGPAVEGIASVGSGPRRYRFRSEPGFAPLPEPPVPTAELDEALARHPFLERAGEALRARPGVWDVAGWLALPAGMALEVGPGTTLRFERGAGLVARGPLRLLGSPEAPVVLEGRAPGPGAWAGLAALESAAPHRWAHVVVRDTAGVRRGGWALTGGVTLRAARVEMERVRFEGSEAEDALNLVRAEIALREVEIRDARSDAIDADFCRGTIEGGEIRGAGGDGLDASGSELLVTDIRIHGVRDKGFSIGEASAQTVRGARVEASGIGLASKDGSTAIVRDSVLRDIGRSGLMSYRKKPGYGPAEIRAEGVTIESRGPPAVAQIGSRLSWEGVEVEPGPLDVEALYRDGPANGR